MSGAEIAAPESVLEQSLGELLEAIADESPLPGAGFAAALVAALATGLVSMASRISTPSWPDANGVKAQAKTLLDRAVPLAQANVEAYEQALAALRAPGGLDERERRDFALGRALAKAAQGPFAITELATDVALLAAVVADEGDPAVRGDAAAAAALAAAAARAGAHLIAINLAATADDPRLRRANDLAALAAEAADRALATGA